MNNIIKVSDYKRIYDERKSSGKCVQCCGVKEQLSKTKCNRCLKKERDLDKFKTEGRICTYCGKSTVDSKNKRICILCKVHRDEYVRNRLRDMKETYVKFMGGKCFCCGLATDKYAVYDFHHKDPRQKDIGINRMFRYSKEKMDSTIKIELAKCILVCSNCHRIIHSDINDGTAYASNI